MTEEVKARNIEFLEKVVFIDNPTEEMVERIPKLLHELTDREERVMRLRFGLDDGVKRTLSEIGMEFNVTGERIRQIIAKGIKKMRHPLRKKIILVG